MKRHIFGYALVFTLGTLFSGGAVFAATNIVKAHKVNVSVQYNSKVAIKSIGLQSGHNTYIDLSAIEKVLKDANMNPTFKSSRLIFHTPSNVIFTFSKADVANLQLQTQKFFSGIASDLNNAQNDYQSNGYKVAVANLQSDEQLLVNAIETTSWSPALPGSYTDKLNSIDQAIMVELYAQLEDFIIADTDQSQDDIAGANVAIQQYNANNTALSVLDTQLKQLELLGN